MTPLAPEWRALFERLMDRAVGIGPPKCPRPLLMEWLGGLSPETPAAADEALLHWLERWSWPTMSAEVSALVWLRMSFAWSQLVEGLERGWPCPIHEAQERGVLHGLLFREWPRHGEAWSALFAKAPKTDRQGRFSN